MINCLKMLTIFSLQISKHFNHFYRIVLNYVVCKQEHNSEIIHYFFLYFNNYYVNCITVGRGMEKVEDI